MTITADSAAATIVLLAPGFVLLSVFYWFGLQVKRSDAQWLIWSLIASAAIKTLPSGGIAVAPFAYAVAGGAVLAIAWNRLPTARFVPAPIQARLSALTLTSSIRAWDSVMARAAWLQVEMNDGRTFIGLMRWAATSVDTDDLDLYLVQPREVVKGVIEHIDGHGILLRRADTRMIIPFPWDRLPPKDEPQV